MRRQLLFAVITIAAVLLLLEGGARLLERHLGPQASSAGDRPGWQAVFFGTLFDWHESDPNLLWRFKAGLSDPLICTNSDRLLGDQKVGPKTPQTYRILLLGDSSPVGMGLSVRRQAFGEMTRFLLDRSLAGRKSVELLNGAVSGYSSEQVRRFLESRGWKYDPDLIIIYCGNNDASLSGRYTDRELLGRQHFASLRAALSHAALYRVLRGILQGRADDGSADKEIVRIRVSPPEYGENLRAIADQCRSHGRPLVILKPPVPYLWPAGLQFKPFLQLAGQDGQAILPPEMARLLGRPLTYCLDTTRYRQLYGQGDIFTRVVLSSVYADTLPPGEAVVYYSQQLALRPDDPVLLNDLGVALWRIGDYRRADSALLAARALFARRYGGTLTPLIQAAVSPVLFNIGINYLSQASGPVTIDYDTSGAAFTYLDSALQADYFSLRIKRDYWRQIDALAGTNGVAVIDLPAIFRASGGERLFFDHCHPNALGHQVIAQALYDTLHARGW